MATEINGVREYLAWHVEARRKLGVHERSEGYHYDSIEDFVLHHGRQWIACAPSPIPVEPMTPKECYWNAQKLVRRWNRTHKDKLRYVEGYASGVIPVLHAWCVTPEGFVVDPTWMGSIVRGHDYFGVVFEPKHWPEGGGPILDRWQEGWPVLRWERTHADTARDSQ